MRMAAFGGQSRRSAALLEQPTPECPLFPKADVQTAGESVKLRSAFGQKRTFNFRKTDKIFLQ